jgi:hypothetical protein
MYPGYDLIVEIFGIWVTQLRRLSPRVRTFLLAGSSIVLLAAIVFAYLAPPVLNGDSSTTRLAAVIVAVIAFEVALANAASFTNITKFGFRGLALELEPLRAERRVIEARIEREPKPDAFSGLELNLTQLKEYYAINRAQARNSFRLGVFVIVVGLVLLGLGIWLYYFSSRNVTVAAITGIGGILGQFVGASGLYMYNKSLGQSTYFYNQLVRLQRLMVAVQLCNDIEDKALRDTTRHELAIAVSSAAYAQESAS